ncbi:GtrA family protein [Paenibacillus sp. LMG 31459]|uniref:GtrA family protein n=1 Tax=Paenibacillus phytohabitans TaxID=2654978 RepID=A0ABX1YHV3_9BACL|nr:GtrA family protein [Paenibacillus phytohabitans]NOU79448.1 GtrA family protein [Paenibacillus phytohabitans]
MNSKFVKYCLIGVTGVIVDFAVFFILTHYAGLHIQMANFISFSCGITNNYIFNVIFNFKIKDKLFSRYIRFYMVGLVSFAVTALLLFIFAGLLHYNEYLVKIIATLLVTIMAFSLNQVISFKKSN